MKNLLQRKWSADDYAIVGFGFFIVLMIMLITAAVFHVESKHKACEDKGGHFFFSKYETICLKKELIVQ